MGPALRRDDARFRLLRTLGVLTLFFSAYFVARFPITPQMALVSSISVLFFALPSYLAVVKLLGKKSGLTLLAVIGLYALTIESSAIKLGFPYGNFTYFDVLGNKLFGLTPWTVAFAYPPIILLAYSFARTQRGRIFALGCGSRPAMTTRVPGMTTLTLFVATILATAIDLVLDPAAVKLGFWAWPTGGFFYNVPLVNFLGWLLTSFIGVSILHHFLKDTDLSASTTNSQPSRLTKFNLKTSGLMILIFWTSVNFWLHQVWPTLIGFTLCVILTTYEKHPKNSNSHR
jgi:bisanhydrobacterioruberin hydratase